MLLSGMGGAHSLANFIPALTRHAHRTPHAILDKSRCLIVQLAGRPSGPGWDGAVQEAMEVLLEAGNKLGVPEKDLNHCKGSFIQYTSGVSYGGGQKVSPPLPTAPSLIYLT